MPMSEPSSRAARLLDLQMHSLPLVNREAVIARRGPDKLHLSVPLQHAGWSLILKRLLPLSDRKNIELDQLGAEVLSLCDGEHAVEDIIDVFMENWMLSFFEARGLILHFLKQLMKSGFVALAAPETES